jgi:two-component system phosphate regulon sensor histidine kinase PhoR
MEPVMTCDAKAAAGEASSGQCGACDSGDPTETRRVTGVSLRLATDHIIVDITSEASTAYLVRRDTGAPDIAETGASPIPWGSDFCAMLLAMLSHDLRQPLQIIMAAHDALDLRLAGELERRQLARIERAAAQVAEKLELLLQALRLREHTGKTELEPVWLDAVLAELAVELGVRARQKRVELRIAAAHVLVSSQFVLLSGILRNLMRNAIDYTPTGGRVLVGCRRRGTTVRIEVHDTGAGISEVEQQSVFLAFQRGTTTRPGGLGLGLFIVKRAADFLGHRIELRSAAGRGSCFSVIADAPGPSDRHHASRV